MITFIIVLNILSYPLLKELMTFYFFWLRLTDIKNILDSHKKKGLLARSWLLSIIYFVQFFLMDLV